MRKIISRTEESWQAYQAIRNLEVNWLLHVTLEGTTKKLVR